MSKDNEEFNIKVEETAKQALNDLLSSVDLHKIILLDKVRGIVSIGGVRAESSRLQNLQAEANFLAESDLWTLLYETPKELAQRAIFIQGESLDDLKKGRAILYTLSVQKNIIDVLKAFKGK